MTIAATELNFEDARAEAADLVSRIEAARDVYYGADASEVDDQTYDGWLHRLEAIEEAHPDLRTQDSPTQTVGAAESTELDTIEHAERMLSLDNVFSIEELRDWCIKTTAAAGRDVRWLTELKIDGLAISLRYEHGVLTSAATRGDGRVGEIVTENALRVPGIPERLAGEGHPALVEVRGEVFIPVEAFRALNAGQAERREQAFAEAQEKWERARSAGKRTSTRTAPRLAAERRFRRSPTRATQRAADCANSSTRRWDWSAQRGRSGSPRCACTCTGSARGRTAGRLAERGLRAASRHGVCRRART